MFSTYKIQHKIGTKEFFVDKYRPTPLLVSTKRIPALQTPGLKRPTRPSVPDPWSSVFYSVVLSSVRLRSAEVQVLADAARVAMPTGHDRPVEDRRDQTAIAAEPAGEVLFKVGVRVRVPFMESHQNARSGQRYDSTGR